MSREENPMPDIEQILQQARCELEAAGSVRPQVQRRVAIAAIKPRRLTVARSVMACLVILAASIWLGRRGIQTFQPLGHGDGGAELPQDVRLEVGNADVTEHIAALVDRGAILVIWSYRGQGMTAMEADVPQVRAGRYRMRLLRKTKSADARTLVCSLFLPDPSVHPLLEPPSICAVAGDRQMIACSVAPRSMSAGELANAISNIHADKADRFDLETVLREISEQAH